MAVEEEYPNPNPSSLSMEDDASSALLSSYLGLSFSVFLALLPRSSLSHVFSLQSRNRILSLKLFHAEEQLRQMRFRRKEDSKANARVAEIFASHRHAWQEEDKRLLHQIEADADEIAALRSQIGEMERSEVELRCSVERLQRELSERDEMIDFMSRRAEPEEGEKEEIKKKDVEQVLGDDEEDEAGCDDAYSWMGRIRDPEGMYPISDACFVERSEDFEKMAMMYCRENGFGPDSLPPSEISKRWMESPKGGWQDIQFDSNESTYPMKHLVARYPVNTLQAHSVAVKCLLMNGLIFRREYPWKVSSDAAGVSSKLKLLEQDLSNLEKVEKGETSKVALLLRKQAKRYQSLAGKIDDLCRKMQLSETFEPSMSPDFRTQRQTEFLVEAFRLQYRAKETRQKLNALHSELIGQAKVAMRRSLDSIRSNLKEIQRNLEIWLARIMGDLEGILARDGNSRHCGYRQKIVLESFPKYCSQCHLIGHESVACRRFSPKPPTLVHSQPSTPLKVLIPTYFISSSTSSLAIPHFNDNQHGLEVPPEQEISNRIVVGNNNIGGHWRRKYFGGDTALTHNPGVVSKLIVQNVMGIFLEVILPLLSNSSVKPIPQLEKDVSIFPTISSIFSNAIRSEDDFPWDNLDFERNFRPRCGKKKFYKSPYFTKSVARLVESSVPSDWETDYG